MLRERDLLPTLALAAIITFPSPSYPKPTSKCSLARGYANVEAGLRNQLPSEYKEEIDGLVTQFRNSNSEEEKSKIRKKIYAYLNNHKNLRTRSSELLKGYGHRPTQVTLDCILEQEQQTQKQSTFAKQNICSDKINSNDFVFSWNQSNWNSEMRFSYRPVSTRHHALTAASRIKKYSFAAPYNHQVLATVAELGQGGGYDVNGGLPFKVSLTHSDTDEKKQFNVTSPKYGPVACSSSTYTVWLKTMERMGAFKGLSEKQMEQFKLKSTSNKNFFGMWNNDDKGHADACQMLASYCETFDFKKNKDQLIPGDFLDLGRKKSGHSAIFMGWADAEKTQVIYWSSHSSTGGFGLKVEPMSRFVNGHVTRITDPNALKNIPDYEDQLDANAQSLLRHRISDINDRSDLSPSSKKSRIDRAKKSAWKNMWKKRAINKERTDGKKIFHAKVECDSRPSNNYPKTIRKYKPSPSTDFFTNPLASF